MNQEMLEDLNYYEVEKIIGKKKEDGKVIYLVKWKNYSESQATWQEVSTLEYVKPLIKQFNEEEKNRKKSYSRSNMSSECINQQNSMIRSHQKSKKTDRGSFCMNSLCSLDEEQQEQMPKNRSSKVNNQHLSNIFLNRQEKVQEVIPKHGQSFRIINRNMPKDYLRTQKLCQFELDNTKELEQDIKGIRKIFKPIKVRLQGSKKIICERVDHYYKQAPKLVDSNVSSLSIVDSSISKNVQKAKQVRKNYSLNDISSERNANEQLSLTKQIIVDKRPETAQECLRIVESTAPSIKPNSSQKSLTTIKRINLLHSINQSSSREYLIQQDNSSIRVLSGKELLKQHPEQLLEYLESLISQKGI